MVEMLFYKMIKILVGFRMCVVRISVQCAYL